MCNPHTAQGLTDREQTNPSHYSKSPKSLNEKYETKCGQRTNADKTTPNSRTLYNPDKPEKPTDSQTRKDDQQSENPASTGITLDNEKGQMQRKSINKVLYCKYVGIHDIQLFYVDKAKQKDVNKTHKQKENYSSGDQAEAANTHSNDESKQNHPFTILNVR